MTCELCERASGLQLLQSVRWTLVIIRCSGEDECRQLGKALQGCQGVCLTVTDVDLGELRQIGTV